MTRIIGFVGLILMSVLVLAGCTNQSPDLVKENTQLKAEVQSLNQELDGANKKIKEQEELYELRNMLDNDWHRILSSLIKGDYESAQQSLVSTVKIKDKKLIFDVNGVNHEFVIPDKPMVLRTSSFMRQGDNYTAVYEIYDDGYISRTKNDSIYFMHVIYVQENGRWRLSDLEFDA